MTDLPTPDDLDLIEHFAEWGAGIDVIDHYEREAELFRRATGFMAPGKSVPLEMARDDDKERAAAWKAWSETRAQARATATRRLVAWARERLTRVGEPPNESRLLAGTNFIGPRDDRW